MLEIEREREREWGRDREMWDERERINAVTKKISQHSHYRRIHKQNNKGTYIYSRIIIRIYKFFFQILDYEIQLIFSALEILLEDSYGNLINMFYFVRLGSNLFLNSAHLSIFLVWQWIRKFFLPTTIMIIIFPKCSHFFKR